MSRKQWSAVVMVAIVVLGLLLLFSCLLEATDGEAWVGSVASISEIGSALKEYHRVHGQLPPAVVRDQDGRPLYSWRVLILPYTLEESLYMVG
jgi:hypothetical protein